LNSRQYVGSLFERSSEHKVAARRLNTFLFALIIMSLIAITLESVASIESKWSSELLIFEFISVILFSIEYVLRIWSAPDNRDLPGNTNLQKRLNYIFSFTGLIDLIAILPTLLQFIWVGADLRLLRVMRLARLLKLSHFTTALEDLVSAIHSERQAFGAALYLMVVALFLSSSLIYVVERDAQPDAFPSIPETMWWAIVTLTTVGYGDVSPVTAAGKLIGAMTAMMGVCTVALLTGIVGAGFSKQMSKQYAEFEHKVREALEDGIISAEEAEEIEALRERMGLSKTQADELANHLIEAKRGNSE
jgi:voltage-gated potassium channel